MASYADTYPTDQSRIDHDREAYIPTEADWEEVRRWDAASDSYHDQGEPTPLEVLDAARPWYEAMPFDPILDTPIGLVEADPLEGARFDPSPRPDRVSDFDMPWYPGR